MAQAYDNQLDEGEAFERIEALTGMDAFARATLLPPDIGTELKNCVVLTNGELATRAGADKVATKPATGRVQGLCYFDTPSYEQVLLGINGSLYTWDGSNFSAALAGWSPANVPLAMAQFANGVGNYRVFISDGSANWRSWDGAALANLGNAATDPPVGATVVCVHANRLFAAGFGTGPDQMRASDLEDAGTGNWPVAFDFRVSAGEGDAIVAMAPLQDDFLAVLKSGSVWVLNTPRDAVDATDFTQSKLTDAVGCVGRLAACRAGNDVIFMGRDGIYSVRRASQSENTYEAGRLSDGLDPYIARINWEYASTIAAAAYPSAWGVLVVFAVPLDSATEPDHVLVLNLKTGRLWGYWTGWNPTAWVVTRFGGVVDLMFGDSAGDLKVWKDKESEDLDETFEDDGAAYDSAGQTRGLLFGDPVAPKRGRMLEARFSPCTASGVVLKVIYDGETRASFPITLQNDGLPFPLVFPIVWPTARPTAHRKVLLGKGRFNEAAIRWEATGGRVKFRNATMSAFIQPARFNDGTGVSA